MSHSFNELALGERLRHLRGRRSLAEVAHISATCRHLRPIAQSTLSLIEQGLVAPTVESLYTLSRIYRVSFARLVHELHDDGSLSRFSRSLTEDESCTWALRVAPSGAVKLRS